MLLVDFTSLNVVYCRDSNGNLGRGQSFHSVNVSVESQCETGSSSPGALLLTKPEMIKVSETCLTEIIRIWCLCLKLTHESSFCFPVCHLIKQRIEMISSHYCDNDDDENRCNR